MVTLISSQTNSVIIGDEEFPKNVLMFQTHAKGEVSIATVNGGEVVLRKHYSLYKNSTNVPYASLSALVTDLRTALFK